eukprot:CAMPEP_0119206038 /NCGR_PEP_ID=MMETSP1316-20130426/40189_1 /TAXON_ID=41880 /ORGANISM="Pycnococcus provasolii, Strain RCC2336" /LENGTH=987 /DNA_ID=CAMNT_0007202437 /DNA_START=57 /DNA_END=3020 /DNA_ORIENTATION=+
MSIKNASSRMNRSSCVPMSRWRIPVRFGSSRFQGNLQLNSTTSRATTTETTSQPETSSDASSSSAAAANGGGQSQAYPFGFVESKWQKYWAQNKTFRTPDITKVDTSKPKHYVLDMFPYPSGAGLHVGHPEGYTATDITSRFYRMRGYNVMHPMGWDAFGLPAEQYAIQTGTHPAVTTAKNVERFRDQLQSLGFSYDWERELATTDAKYFKWTQWIFLQLLEKGLAYRAEVPVNWCPALGTVLANEEVIDGLSERGGHPVVKKPMMQWMLRITEYADRLLEDLDELDWPEGVKEMQRNWIGRSEGASVSFPLSSSDDDERLTVFTTRPDTLFGVTFVCVAPEHPWLMDKLVTEAEREAVEAYVEAASRKSDRERTGGDSSAAAAGPSGVFTGAYVEHPTTGESLPVFCADYVLGGYGEGAVMGVPAHDERDFEFQKKVGGDRVGVRVVVHPKGSSVEDVELPFCDKDGIVAANSSGGGLDINGMAGGKARKAVTEHLAENGFGEARVNYRLRDWLFARQRYWGEPFPVMYPLSDPSKVVPVSVDDLPITLPETETFQPTGDGKPPLSACEEWVRTTVPESSAAAAGVTAGEPAERETSTMPQWAGSCWYYLRFADPSNDRLMIDPEVEKYWLPVDLYVGGTEHATLHLLYARFWHKVLYDLGVVSTKEPFRKLVNQGMILGEVEFTGYVDTASGMFVDPNVGEQMLTEEDGAGGARGREMKLSEDDVEKKGDGYYLRDDSPHVPEGQSMPVKISARAHKMSKSRGNVINPDDVVFQYGADSLRLYEMFMGPLRDTKVWSTSGVEGVHRFLARAWRLMEGDEAFGDVEPTEEQLRSLHICIKKVTEMTEGMAYNTAISAMMEFVNDATKWEQPRPKSVLHTFSLLLSPYAPHIAEEMACRLRGGDEASIAYEEWPAYDESLIETNEVLYPVQVNGKVRAKLMLSKDITEDEAVASAMADENVQKFTDGKEVKKVIFRSGKILNIVVSK